MDKQSLIDVIIKKLEAIHQVAISATQSAIEAATNEETVPENKYDTLALEAAYLAHGQARRVQECEADIQRFKALSTVSFDLMSAVGLTAIIQLIDENDQENLFFMGPCAGGINVTYQNQQVTIITPEAPLGKAMLGQRVGDEVVLKIAGKQVGYEIISIT
ncbi:GreA/GreB family elongation factor [Vibrio sp. TH_r3]|uniref:GreA/GreB family elongation factor n=1 Tax=Vibrio sp. TH_r3 TaxID=3082084 RepID=UPI002952B204|nr:GreA/GreB family elongation factor [Vibrio sp. TH_r3]MDV7104762.1 GreA/GreB family elongation factor [Vibrio sp. TH_r3]